MKSFIKTTAKFTLAAILVAAGFGMFLQVGTTGTPNQASIKSAYACTSGVCPTPVPALLGSCYPDRETVGINEDVNWTAVASGGTGSYTYSWRDDEGEIGTGSRVSTSYYLTGRKDVIVSITSGSYTIQRLCHVNVVTNTVPLSVYCVANPTQANVNETVTYTVTATGGTGSYTYSWSGTDGLSSNSRTASKSYGTSGTKSASVIVTSGSLSKTATCSSYINQVQTPALNLSCVASPSSANINETIVYTANASGGDGNFSYSWSGTDGLSGSGSIVSKQYGSTGTKTGTVTVTSGSQSRTATCSSFINQQQNNPIYVSCYASPSQANINDNVSWYANATGGNGNYTYSWNGTDGLYGNSQTIYKSYGTSGSKTGNVTVYSNGQQAQANCSMNVNGGNNTQYLTAYCYGTPSNAAINTNVTWYGSATGGNGNYNYSWTGADSLYGYNQTISKYYTFSGSKNAVLTVTSNGQTAQANCSININGINGSVVLTQNPTGNLSSGVFLSQVPYTGGELNLKVALFVLGLFMFSAFAAYMIILKKNARNLATTSGKYSQKEMIERFKQENLSRKG